MGLGELLTLLSVILIVFGPQKLPMLARHLGRLAQFSKQLSGEVRQFLDQQVAQDELRLREDQAKQVDADYQQKVNE